ncbi:MAG: hypothetical protein RLZZ59_900 [Pseudomonadota bacterium]
MLCKQFIIDDVILSEASQNHKNLVLAYQNTIWNSYSEVVKKQHHNSILDTEINRLYVKYLKDTSNFFKHSNSIRIDILDDERNLIFSSNDVEMIHDDYQTLSLYDYITAKIDELLFAQSHHKDWISLAYNGKIVRSLLTNVKIEPKISKEDRISVSVDYIPLINNQGHTESVVVLYTNASNLIKGIWGLEHRIIALLLILALIFCIMVAYNTYYTRRVITEQLRVNKLLEEAKARAESESSAKTEFLAGVSHELRTPLNAIIGFSEMILSEHGKDIEKSQHDSYISSIHHAGKHLLSVINDILDYLKAASDKLNVDMVDVDINKIVRSSMRLIAPKAIEKNIELIEDTSSEHIVITADPKRLKQAVLNLLSNSIKFTKNNGKISVVTIQNREKHVVCIKIIDTGIGIEEKDIHKALSTFGQVDNSMSRQYDGTGLGLPLTKKLTELMGGTFEITSKKDIGTTVTLIFPCKQ